MMLFTYYERLSLDRLSRFFGCLFYFSGVNARMQFATRSRWLLHQSVIYNSKLSAVHYTCWGSPMHFSRMKGRSFVRSARATILKRASVAIPVDRLRGMIQPIRTLLSASSNVCGSFLCNPFYCASYRPERASMNAPRHRLISYRFPVRDLWTKRAS